VDRETKPGIGRRRQSLTVLWDTPTASDISRWIQRRSNARRSASSTYRIRIISAEILPSENGCERTIAARMVPSEACRVIGMGRETHRLQQPSLAQTKRGKAQVQRYVNRTASRV
jgi:hypothetical protein